MVHWNVLLKSVRLSATVWHGMKRGARVKLCASLCLRTKLALAVLVYLQMLSVLWLGLVALAVAMDMHVMAVIARGWWNIRKAQVQPAVSSVSTGRRGALRSQYPPSTEARISNRIVRRLLSGLGPDDASGCGRHSACMRGDKATTGECKHKHVQRSCKASTHHEKLLKTEREEVWMYAGGRWVDGAMDRPLISKLAIDRVSTVQYTRSRLLCRISSGQSAATCN